MTAAGSATAYEMPHWATSPPSTLSLPAGAAIELVANTSSTPTPTAAAAAAAAAAAVVVLAVTELASSASSSSSSSCSACVSTFCCCSNIAISMSASDCVLSWRRLQWVEAIEEEKGKGMT